ncbi:hypothetical protein QEZ54_28850 [Catellatospora sp. KI3]|uniref:hypothetical protein n=1 Tax=Catellatospora sp. KI3 TaxID=3041620 RepID=UPI0024822543|nr:hypothetical protein [Catellatospora sp. KI3]MDI1464985.1 hypothetical protein [Catellatospora sp. KI3]
MNRIDHVRRHLRVLAHSTATLFAGALMLGTGFTGTAVAAPPSAPAAVGSARAGNRIDLAHDLPRVPAEAGWRPEPGSARAADEQGLRYLRPGGPDLDFHAFVMTEPVDPDATDTPIARVRLGSRLGHVYQVPGHATTYGRTYWHEVRWRVGDVLYSLVAVPGRAQSLDLDTFRNLLRLLRWP